MKTSYLLALLLLQSFIAPGQIALQLELVSGAFSEPVDIANAGDERLFIVEKGGVIRILLPDGELKPVPFLDIDPKVNSNAGERGLLGLVFHPDYVENGYFFVNYSNSGGNTVVARYQVSAADPDVADPESEKILLTVDQPFANHNGGDLNFGPDGYLYIGMGDGGSGGDPRDNSQTRQALLGKMLRIDVDNGDPYAIPADNPFIQDSTTLDEIWALGLRNPWRFSFDRLTGDLWIGDVGQGNWEEINRQPANSTGGENYGWRCYEGLAVFNASDCGDASTYQFPVFQYNSSQPTGCSVTGGFVYRGATFPLLYGLYLYTDYCSGKIWALSQNEAQEWVNQELHDGPDGQFVSFGEDQQGELYLASIEGGIFRVTDQTTTVGEVALDAQLQLQPNPFDKNILIEGTLPENGGYHLRLFNAQGQAVWEANEYLEKNFSKNIATDKLAKGVYFFSIQRNGARQVLKLIKQ